MDAAPLAAYFATCRLTGFDVCRGYTLPLFARKTAANTAVCALAISLTQLATECMDSAHNFTHMLAASWSIALKLIYDESTFLVDVLSVWNEILGRKKKMTSAQLLEAEQQILLFAAKSVFFNCSIPQHIHIFRSALLRTLLEERNKAPTLVSVREALTVMIIDDCSFTLEHHGVLVKTAAPNAVVHLASSYSQALIIYADPPPHVILVDLKLNDEWQQNGFELAVTLQARENRAMSDHREGCHTKEGDVAPALVVAVSAHCPDEKTASQFDAVCQKPLTLQMTKCILGHAWNE